MVITGSTCTTTWPEGVIKYWTKKRTYIGNVIDGINTATKVTTNGLQMTFTFRWTTSSIVSNRWSTNLWYSDHVLDINFCSYTVSTTPAVSWASPWKIVCIVLRITIALDCNFKRGSVCRRKNDCAKPLWQHHDSFRRFIDLSYHRRQISVPQGVHLVYNCSKPNSEPITITHAHFTHLWTWTLLWRFKSCA